MSSSLGIIFNENQKSVLLVKRRDIPIWVLPGGRWDLGESPEDAVIREVYEETGFHVEIVNKVAEYSYTNSDKKTFSYICRIIGGNKTFSKESKEIEYFRIDNLPKMIHPHMSQSIKDALAMQSGVIYTVYESLGKSYWLKALVHPWALFKYLLTTIGIHWNT